MISAFFVPESDMAMDSYDEFERRMMDKLRPKTNLTAAFNYFLREYRTGQRVNAFELKQPLWFDGNLSTTEFHLILDALVQNAIDRQGAGLIDVSLKQEGKQIVLRVTNRGATEFYPLREKAAGLAERGQLVRLNLNKDINKDVLVALKEKDEIKLWQGATRVFEHEARFQLDDERLPWIYQLGLEKRKGRGLGYVYGKVVSQAGGEVALESVGKKTTVTVKLPAADFAMAARTYEIRYRPNVRQTHHLRAEVERKSTMEEKMDALFLFLQIRGNAFQRNDEAIDITSVPEDIQIRLDNHVANLMWARVWEARTILFEVLHDKHLMEKERKQRQEIALHKAQEFDNLVAESEFRMTQAYPVARSGYEQLVKKIIDADWEERTYFLTENELGVIADQMFYLGETGDNGDHKLKGIPIVFEVPSLNPYGWANRFQPIPITFFE